MDGRLTRSSSVRLVLVTDGSNGGSLVQTPRDQLLAIAAASVRLAAVHLPRASGRADLSDARTVLHHIADRRELLEAVCDGTHWFGSERSRPCVIDAYQEPGQQTSRLIEGSFRRTARHPMAGVTAAETLPGRRRLGKSVCFPLEIDILELDMVGQLLTTEQERRRFRQFDACLVAPTIQLEPNKLVELIVTVFDVAIDQHTDEHGGPLDQGSPR